MNEENILQFRKELQNLGYCKSVVNGYPKRIKEFFEYQKKPKEHITSEDIKHYYFHLKTIQSKRTKQPLSESHITGILRAVNTYFEYLERTGQIKLNPYQLKIKIIKYEERKVFTGEEIRKLYNKSSTLQTIILHLCYACGMRRNEASELKITDIDLENCLLYIRKGKGKKRRVIPFTKQVQKDIKDFIFHSRSDLFFSNGVRESAKLISSEGKEYLLNITAERIYTEFSYLLKKAGLYKQGFTLHCLRHTIATQLLEQGMELEKVRDFLGHQYLGTTQIYTRIKAQWKSNNI